MNVYKKLIRLREEPALRDGDYTSVAVDKNILVYKREAKQDPRANKIVVVLNFGSTSKTVNLTAVYPNLSKKLQIVVTSIHSPQIDGDVVDASRVVAHAEVGTVLRTI